MRNEIITMEHGAGGEAMRSLISRVLLRYLCHVEPEAEVGLRDLDDSAVVEGIVITTDSHTVKPIFFPGGDIGILSVAGTVNDLAVMGARPIALSFALVIEEGFAVEDLERILESVSTACNDAGVGIVTGDTKVMERGSIDGLITNTTGIGFRHPLLDRNLMAVPEERRPKWPADSEVRNGDVIIVSGTVGDHGIAVLSYREGYGFETEVMSDVAPLNGLIEDGLSAGGIVAMKDPTRGGVANALNEWSWRSEVGILIEEEHIPYREEVLSACELLGIDPLEVGNEGKVLMAVVPEKAEEVLEAIRRHPLGRDAAIIGMATSDVKGVVMQTTVGGRRIVDPPIGDPVPRIC